MEVTRIGDHRRKRKGKRKSKRKDASQQRALEGLQDALGLMLTRVIEDEVSIEEARTMLDYLQKELDAIDPPAGGRRPTRRSAKRKSGARKARKKKG